MCIRALCYGPLLFAAVNRFSQEIDKHLWGWADNRVTDQHVHSRTHDFFLHYSLLCLSISKLILFTAASNKGPYHTARMRMLIHIFIISPNHRCAGLFIS